MTSTGVALPQNAILSARLSSPNNHDSISLANPMVEQVNSIDNMNSYTLWQNWEQNEG